MAPSTPPTAPSNSGPARGATLRLFLALWPDPEARAGALRWQAAQDWPKTARLHPAGNLHLTLPFIGAVAQAKVPDLAAACAVRLQPFEFELDHLETWPRGTVVLAPTIAAAALLDLHQRLGCAVRAQGITLESRPYRPHMTLARHATALNPVAAGLMPVRWRVSRYVLAASSSGRYSVVQSYPASGAPRQGTG